jgi:hypothetical protein
VKVENMKFDVRRRIYKERIMALCGSRRETER